ncbi:hypothetical protein MMC21_002752 [Puttea exsequens]|nr:hypothetical protein [Puttea exsequens]
MQQAPRRPSGAPTPRSPPLTTTNLPPPQRFSYQETPVEAERATFHQFSSPTNSTIDESPITPATPSSRVGLPGYTAGPEREGSGTPLPAEKAMQAVSPGEVHPAFYAPVREEVGRQGQGQGRLQENRSGNGAAQRDGRQQPNSLSSKPAAPTTTTTTATTPSTSTPSPSPPTFSPPPRTATTTIAPDTDPTSISSTHHHRPGQSTHPNSLIAPDWKTSLCAADGVCCMGLLCPCMLYGKTMYRLGRKAARLDPTDMLGYDGCNGGCGVMAGACGVQWILASLHRTRIRRLYHIRGSIGNDCGVSLCCCCCVLMQNEREVRAREELVRRYAGPSGSSGMGLGVGVEEYVKPAGMVYAPPPR